MECSREGQSRSAHSPTSATGPDSLLDPRPRGRRGLSCTVRLIAHGASNASAYAEIAESLIPARLPIERH